MRAQSTSYRDAPAIGQDTHATPLEQRLYRTPHFEPPQHRHGVA
jgi:hypothetical protein